MLAARSADVTRMETELAAFKIRYRHEVGLLHEELDELELKISEIELGEIARRLESEGGDSDVGSGAPKADTGPRYTSDTVRKLFRDVAKVIHPDLARDDHARDRRHSLMIEANRAYALGDEERLRSILHAWERSPEAVQGSGRRGDTAAARAPHRADRGTARGLRGRPGGAQGVAALEVEGDGRRRLVARQGPRGRHGETSEARHRRRAQPPRRDAIASLMADRPVTKPAGERQRRRKAGSARCTPPPTTPSPRSEPRRRAPACRCCA